MVAKHLFTIVLILYSLCGCQKQPSRNTNLPEANNGEAHAEEALDTAIKISGKKFSSEQRCMMLRMLSLSEKDLITGLRVFAELSGGRYPSQLDAKTTIKQMDGLGHNSKISRSELKKRAQDIFFASAYYEKLVRAKKDVAYHGDQVTVEDIGKVLVRWRISDGRYKVVFGNLTTESAVAGRLAELESEPVE